MGAQSQNIENIYSIVQESNINLKKIASNAFNKKHFSIEECCDKPDEKFNFLIKTFFDPCDKTIGEFVDKKLSGQLDNEYRKVKLLSNLNVITFDWECLNMEDKEDCCNWKKIEW